LIYFRNFFEQLVNFVGVNSSPGYAYATFAKRPPELEQEIIFQISHLLLLGISLFNGLFAHYRHPVLVF
jgi:hypothetical protein